MTDDAQGRAKKLLVEIFGNGGATVLKPEVRQLLTQALRAERQAAYQACRKEIMRYRWAFPAPACIELQRLADWCEAQAGGQS